ncbi:Xaa-Pro aminopeptidase [Morganella morganii]|nr:hypothetical protein [Morganella morganii]STZ12096.1 Xaa-Pro aminopeptidase [Morganella morganii]
MRQRNLDVLIVYGDRESAAPAPFCVDHYFTNDRLGSVVIFYQDNDPVVVTFAPMMIADHMQAALRGDNQWLSPSQIMVGKTGRNIGALLREMNVPAAAQIGVIGLEPYPPFYFDGAMPFNTLTGIKEAYPQAAILPIYRDFFVRASVKSEEELAHIRHAAAIGEAMSEAMRVTAVPGNSEADIAAAVTATCLSAGDLRRRS